ncbi:hypothetical protein ACIQXM_01945 [Arthrobacter sp. NPDC097144]|uniref:hypothetical protein n=1 Tax=Arthrobacter sp. NPDC097144 TaxID=3363946 RepID=UPI0037F1DF10
MSPCTATSCSVPLSGGITLCHDHTTLLEEALREVPDAWQNIYVSACKLDVGAGSVGGMGGEASGSEPANLDALDKGDQLLTVLRGWVALMPGTTPHGTAPALAGWLVGQLRTLRRQDWAADLLQELRDALNACNHATDRAGEKVFAGMCPTERDGWVCDQPLYALAGRPVARCRTCGQEWDVSDWRERALTAAEYQHGTAAQISRMLSDPVTREALPQATIRQWVRRQKLNLYACDVATRRNQYLVADVRTLWAATKAAGYKRAQFVA